MFNRLKDILILAAMVLIAITFALTILVFYISPLFITIIWVFEYNYWIAILIPFVVEGSHVITKRFAEYCGDNEYYERFMLWLESKMTS